MLVGNPMLPALHGGATSAFLETTAIIELSWAMMWDRMEAGEDVGNLRLPKTIDFTVDYLRTGLPRDAYARATINRSGRRYASVHVEAWQDNRTRMFAQATGHFLMPQDDG
jgi:acyl-coenzyme A thioesterase PaaI-like protein